MTSKRLKKLYMSIGVPRDTADFIIRHIAVTDGSGGKYSNQDKWEKLSVEVTRLELADDSK